MAFTVNMQHRSFMKIGCGGSMYDYSPMDACVVETLNKKGYILNGRKEMTIQSSGIEEGLSASGGGGQRRGGGGVGPISLTTGNGEYCGLLP